MLLQIASIFTCLALKGISEFLIFTLLKSGLRSDLKVLSNENRGGWRVVSINRL
jgi:hypothetical protein